MTCPRCQVENDAGARFCEDCGARLEAACPSCGTPVTPGKRFCRSCGAALTPEPSPFTSPESYTPKHLAEKILTSKATLEGERKQVTVLFADLKGSMELLADRDPEEARKLLDPVLEHMMEAVHRYEGTVNQVMGDGIMALFGAPLAHEDHAVRACYAALRMQESVKRYADAVRREHGAIVRIRVGLNSGEVVVRAIGSDLHMDYSAVGQTTHLAARMEQLAEPGSTLLTSETLMLAEGFVQVTSLGPMAVKGLPAPVEVFELTGVSAVRSRLHAAAARGLSRFVGRDAEVEQLRRALEQARQGRGQVAQARELAEHALGLSRQRSERGTEARILYLFGEISAQSVGQDERAAAERHYVAAVALAEEASIWIRCEIGRWRFMLGSERDWSCAMARIDLIDVCKTLTERDRAGSGSIIPRTMPNVVSAPSGGGRGSAFSIQNLNLTIPDGETVVILGPSGCGKTTLLKIIAGLIPPEAGAVRYDNVDVKDVPPGERRIGMVFQSYALYPHLSSRTNVLSYFLFKKKTPELGAMAKAKYQRTSELMGVELEYLLDRKPTTLSGGEKQRVALGRCITRDPALFLLDEPFSSLDQALREKYRVNLKILLRQFNLTTVYVTHDHYEALILADLLVIMDRGSIEQVGTYEEIYNRPKNMFVAGFLNRHIGTVPINLIDARYMAQGQRLGDVRVGVRPEDVDVSREEREDTIKGIIKGKVSLPMLNTTILSIHVAEHEVHAQTSVDENFLTGDEVWLGFKRYHAFDNASGVRRRSYPETL